MIRLFDGFTYKVGIQNKTFDTLIDIVVIVTIKLAIFNIIYDKIYNMTDNFIDVGAECIIKDSTFCIKDIGLA